jgi:hypothetical protein
MTTIGEQTLSTRDEIMDFRNPRLIDRRGQRFGYLTVLRRAPDKGRHRYWQCVCDCGRLTTVAATNLQGGQVKSCGCERSELISQATTVHGQRQTRLYSTWCGMKARCLRASHKDFADYGGRGITIHPTWQRDFRPFSAYVCALPHFGEAGRSLDRINPDGNYEPGNVRWATGTEQRLNRRKPR